MLQSWIWISRSSPPRLLLHARKDSAQDEVVAVLETDVGRPGEVVDVHYITLFTVYIYYEIVYLEK